MTEQLLTNEPLIRISVFIGVLLMMAGLEAAMPKRKREASRRVRWPNNLALVALNTAVLRVLFPAAAIGVALYAQTRNWGLINSLQIPAGFSIPAAVIALDFIIYIQHRAFHAVPVLWRLHRMHHSDIDIDVTTGARFHPVEIVLSMLIKFAVIVLLGAPAAAVLVFEVLLNATAMFNHANVRIPGVLDKWLRLIVVTPDMHRVHHSVVVDETNSNFGFNLPWWDRIFRTYIAQPTAGHDEMTIGLPLFREPRELWLDRLLLQPLRSEARRAGKECRSRWSA